MDALYNRLVFLVAILFDSSASNRLHIQVRRLKFKYNLIFRYLAVCKNRNLTNRQLFLMVFAAYFITWLHAFPNSFLSLEIGPSPDSLEFTRELQTFPDWTNNVPSYAVTVLVKYCLFGL